MSNSVGEFDLAAYHVQLIPIDQIELDKYQRTTDPKRVSLIAQEFDWDAFDPIKVSMRNGRYYAVDGGHRVQVLRLLGVKFVPAVVVEGLVYSQEARLFARKGNRKNVKPITASDELRALYEAGHPEIRGLIDTLGEYGFDVYADFKAYDTLRRVYSRYGKHRLGNVAAVLRIANVPSIPGWLVESLAEIVDRFAGRIDFVRLGTKIRDNWSDIDAEKRRKAPTITHGVHRGSEIILGYYNWNLRASRLEF